MTNKDLLMKAIEKRGIKVGYLCQLCGFSHGTFINKRDNKPHSEFTAREISVITDTLMLTSEERDKIFFAKESE